ncbi:MAG: immune inhibitor A [Deltaproteobacteria bacterium]|nr:immune inhibitor A [Deltaproteobacteria bacterium]
MKKVLLFIFAFFSLSLALVSQAAEFQNQGCVIQTPEEVKLKDYALDQLRDQSLPHKSSPFSLFDFKEVSPFPFVPNHQKVSYKLVTTSKIVVLLVEFTDPEHNKIEKPTDQDNTSLWVPDFSPKHYEELLFSREPGKPTMSNYYLENSSGRYTVEGKVFGWFKVSHPESHYGKDIEGPGGHDNANGPVWRVMEDMAREMKGPLDWSQFDTIDRYDWDNDGNLNEPDGYLDHVMIVHAGEGQEAGGGAQGDDAIWSHRSRAKYQPLGGGKNVGPQKYAQRGGIQISAEQDLWILDYTMMPEDGATGVFAHEFGHDLGLPDLYDTAPVNNSESSVEFWSIMSAGSWISKKNEPLGTFPTHFSAWEKMKLGWLDYDEMTLGKEDLHKFALLDRAEFHGQKAQALKINLPKATKVIKISDPIEGKFYWYSDSGDELVHSLEREIDLTGVEKATLTFKTFYDIEPDYDYAYVEIENSEGKLISIPGNITTDTDPNGSNLGNGITGKSQGWVEAVFDLTPYVGVKRRLRFRYVTDGAEGGKGFTLDDLKISETGLQDGFEEEGSWVSDGFLRIENGERLKTYSHAYFLEWKTYHGFDEGLQSIYYRKNEVWADTYTYSPGLLLWYENNFYEEGDNQVGKHPGEGHLLLVDSRPDPEKTQEGKVARARFQLHDAPFSFWSSQKFVIDGMVKMLLGGTQAVPVFNDSHSYWNAEAPHNSVRLPKMGLSFSLLNTSPDDSAVQVGIHYSAPVRH